MATTVFLVFLLAMARVSDGAWCVCNLSGSTSDLQKTLDYACGAGADCGPIHQNGACYNPNTVVAHCSYAANSYYQRNGQTQQACDFSGTATLTANDPSSAGCTFPATPSAAGTSGTPTGNSSSTPGSSLTPGSSTPGGSVTPGSSLTPPGSSSSSGTFSNSPASTFGLGPSGNGLDSSDSASVLPQSSQFAPPLTIFISVLIVLMK